MPPAPQPALPLRPGALFAGRYQIEHIVGQGGMGTVYRARDLSLAEPVALKLLPFDPDSYPALALRFRQEVKLARRVTHPAVIRVHDLGEEQGALYLTMELIEGDTLRALLRAERRLSIAAALRVARAVVEGLRAAHAAGVIHRDLKPTNILLDRSGRVVLTDFGIARCLDDDSVLTQGPIGTPSYMSPEQSASGPVDARSDLYALGLVLYEMLTGERPSGAASEIAARLEGRAPQDATWIPAPPPALAALILRCLARDPEARPQSADEVLRLLEHTAPDLVDDPTTLPVGLAPPAPPISPSLSLSGVAPPEGRVGGAAPFTAAGRAGAGRAGGGGAGLAVLPFKYRGSGEQEYLGEAIADELVDVLSRTRGVRVLGSGATARFRDTRDPLAIGRELRVQAVIDGAVQAAGGRVRLTVRLLDAATGVQLWSEHHDGGLSDLFAFQESIARRVAEELRVELNTLVHSGTAPTEAIDQYLAARRVIRGGDYESSARAVALLERAIELAPAFSPALAAHAIACARAWFHRAAADHGPGWEQATADSVARALARAPELAETHLAAAMQATQRGEYRDAAAALSRALAIAPTYAEAHEYLGVLQCEVGQLEQGLTRLRLAHELDPTLLYSLLFLARHHALEGDRAAFEAVLAELERSQRPQQFPYNTVLRIRVAAWWGDREAIERVIAGDALHSHSRGKLTLIHARAALGEANGDEVDAGYGRALEVVQSPRFRSMLTQLWAEACAVAGRHDAALARIRSAAESVLIDLVWLDRCPLLAPLRGRPELAEARRLVRARADSVWAP